MLQRTRSLASIFCCLGEQWQPWHSPSASLLTAHVGGHWEVALGRYLGALPLEMAGMLKKNAYDVGAPQGEGKTPAKRVHVCAVFAPGNVGCVTLEICRK